MKRNEVVLLYHMKDEAKAKRIKMVLLLMGVKMKMVSPEQYDRSIESLLSGSSNNSKEEKANVPTSEVSNETPHETEENESKETALSNTDEIDREMMVLYGFSGKRLDELLIALRKNQARVDLKAVVTETNKTWTSKMLYRELVKEHTMMSRKKEAE